MNLLVEINLEHEKSPDKNLVQEEVKTIKEEVQLEEKKDNNIIKMIFNDRVSPIK